LFSEGEVIDDGIVGQAPGCEPPAFDICAHGGVRVLERILESLERLGAPLRDDDSGPSAIWPVRNLIDREAIDALRQAQTQRAVRFLAWQRQHLPPALDAAADLCLTEPARAMQTLEAMVGGFKAGRRLIEGATVAIVGPTNAGKSTLFNRLAGRSAAIVSARAGTTRDWVTASVEIDGIPLTLVDTAGQRAAEGTVEEMAIEGGLKIARDSDLCLLVFDGSRPLPYDTAQLSRVCASHRPRLIVLNKIDLPQRWQDGLSAGDLGNLDDPPMYVSARNGAGVSELSQAILRMLGCSDLVDTAPCLFTTRQQKIALEAVSDLLKHPAKAELWLRNRLLGS
jgi:small GTP-binding protein